MQEKENDPEFAVTVSAWKRLIFDRDSIGLPALRLMDAVDFLPPDDLSPEEKQLIVNQARTLIRNFYPHLPFKREDFPDSDSLAMLGGCACQNSGGVLRNELNLGTYCGQTHAGVGGAGYGFGQSGNCFWKV